jgi:putative ABC transport system permease protein
MLRATLKSLLSRKLRLVLSGLAVILGVMFVSGALVLTDTLSRSFTNLFASAYANTDVQVAAKARPGSGDNAQDAGATLPASLVDQVGKVPGVASATGRVQVDGAQVVGSNGKVVGTFGAPQYGTNWTGTSTLVHLTEGRAVRSDDEVMVNGGLADAAGLHVGDQVGVLTLQSNKQTFTLVGIFGYSGGRGSLGGEQIVAFTTPRAQQLMLGQQNVYTSIDVRAGPGQSVDQLRDQVATAIGGGYDVKTGKQLAADATKQIQDSLSFFNYILLGFAGVALFVGIFLILNTFSIIVAQRTRELALMRAMGASRRQVTGSVLVEAVVVGTLASVLGLAAGIGVGAALAYLFGHLGGSNLRLDGVGVPASAVLGAFSVGIVITVIAAMLPAMRAARVAPVAAMQEAATPDRPLTKITVAGSAVFAVGAILLGIGLGGAGGATLTLILSGVLFTFVGVAMLTPLISRPVVSLLGRAFAWSVPGQLGRRNSARNPRRTAITAGALMVGIALITGVNVILQSATASLNQLADTKVSMDLIISGQQNGPHAPAFDPQVLKRTAALSGVAEVTGFYDDGATIDGASQGITAVDNVAGLHDMFGVTASAGSIDQIGSGQLIVDQPTATKHNLHLGDKVTIQLAHGSATSYTVSGIYAKSDVLNGYFVGMAAVPGFRSNQATGGFIKLAPGASVDTVKNQINALLADSPRVNVADRSEYVKQQAAQTDSILTMIQILLALAILIAVLGIVNTLALSVLERTRELGLLRAIGLRRAQAMRMVTVEAVVISVYGALLGLAVGCGLGVAVVHALKDDGFSTLALPWTQMVEYLVLAGIVGVVAAVLPAIRAARTNVLAAIAYE